MSVNWPKSDRSKWVVPIVVAFIAAIGTVIAALAPSLFGGDDDAAPSNVDTPPTAPDGVPGTGRPTPSKPATPATTSTDGIAYSGNDRVLESDPAVDLDSSTDGTGGDNVGDLVHTNLALTTGSGSLIALLDRAQIPTLDVCRSALDERGVDMISAPQIEFRVRALDGDARGIAVLSPLTGGTALRLSLGVAVDLPQPATNATATLVHAGEQPARMTSFSAAGDALDQATVPAAPGTTTPSTTTLTGPGIVTVRVGSQGAEAFLVRIYAVLKTDNTSGAPTGGPAEGTHHDG